MRGISDRKKMIIYRNTSLGQFSDELIRLCSENKLFWKFIIEKPISAETFPGPCQTSKMERFAEIVDNF